MKYGFRYWCIKTYLWVAPKIAQAQQDVYNYIAGGVQK